jgi:hypothetical protein
LQLSNYNRVSLIVQQSPQFATRDDVAGREGITPPPQWHESASNDSHAELPILASTGLDPLIGDTLSRLHCLFQKPEGFDLTTTDFHDLTCFVLHRLLDDTTSPIDDTRLPASLESEAIRYAIVLYLLMVHGPTYFSHVRLQYTTTLKLKALLEQWILAPPSDRESLWIWVLSIGMAASDGTPEYHYFTTHAHKASTALGISAWETALPHHKAVLWLENVVTDRLFRRHWEAVWVLKPDI